jgi:quinol---cytochrome c reductase iron-sulfur subunit, bacillus type
VTLPENISRRAMLAKLGILLNGIIGTILAIPIVGYVLSPVGRAQKDGNGSWLPLGALGQYPAGQTRLATFRNPGVVPWDGKTADSACWVRRIDDASFQVFAINCAHLGCPVRWFPQSRLFMCPCHGGVYYEDGARASGPPERGLFEYEYKLEDGNLFIKARGLPTPGSSTAMVNISEKLPCG